MFMPKAAPLSVIVAALLSSCTTVQNDVNMKTSEAVTQYYAEQKPSDAVAALNSLASLAPRDKPVRIAVYEIPDLTGKNKPNENYAEYSRAVTQGAEALVIQALTEVAQGRWFDVVERRFVERVLNERTLVERAYLDTKQRNFLKSQDYGQDKFQQEFVRAIENVNKLEAEYKDEDLVKATIVSSAKQRLADFNRKIEDAKARGDDAEVARLLADQRQFATDVDVRIGEMETKVREKQAEFEQAQRELQTLKQVEPKPEAFQASMVPPSLPYVSTANYILTGGIIDYSTNVDTGGAGLGLMNVRAYEEVRRDMVTLNLRLVDTKTSRIIATSTVTKSIYSKKAQLGGAGYVTLKTVLEGEAGISVNEPGVFALSRAIELALNDIIKTAQTKGVW
jgi:curli biogenesis system outer membrane secretion channel CsgG